MARAEASSVPTAMMGRMTITMQNFALTWTDPDGIPCSSAVAYDKPSTGRRKQELEEAGRSDIRIVKTEPSQLPEAAA